MHGMLPQMMPMLSSTMFQILKSVNSHVMSSTAPSRAVSVIFLMEHANAKRPMLSSTAMPAFVRVESLRSHTRIMGRQANVRSSAAWAAVLGVSRLQKRDQEKLTTGPVGMVDSDVSGNALIPITHAEPVGARRYALNSHDEPDNRDGDVDHHGAIQNIAISLLDGGDAQQEAGDRQLGKGEGNDGAEPCHPYPHERLGNVRRVEVSHVPTHAVVCGCQARA